MTVRVYSSLDASAPVLTEASSTLIAVLDACLVNGYGSKVSSGWAKSFALSTTGAAYRPPAGNRFYLMVDDSGGVFPRARIIANATAWNAGEWVSPVEAMIPGGLHLPKHNNVTGSRAWVVIATDKFMYFWTQWSQDLDNTKGALWYFGDVKPVRSSDVNATILAAASAQVDTSRWPGTWGGSNSALTPAVRTTMSQSPPAVNQGFDWCGKVWARSFTGVGAGIYATTQHDLAHMSHGLFTSGNYFDTGASNITYGYYQWLPNLAGNPSPVDGSLYLSPVMASEGYYNRGTVPGLWVPMFGGSPTLHGTRMVGNGEYAGKEFMFLHTPYGTAAIEVSDTW